MIGASAKISDGGFRTLRLAWPQCPIHSYQGSNKMSAGYSNFEAAAFRALDGKSMIWSEPPSVGPGVISIIM
jgi:hypothetical protein